MKLAALQQVCNDLTEVEILKKCEIDKININYKCRLSEKPLMIFFNKFPFVLIIYKRAMYNMLLLQELSACA